MLLGRFLWAARVVWFLARLFARLLEILYLYAPLVPLGVCAWIVDSLTLLLPKASKQVFGPCDADNWWAAWRHLAIRRVQQSGPVFVKFAQWASTRPDYLPRSFCEALKTLQDQTEPHSLEHTHRILDKAFPHKRWYQAFLIEPEPIGSGCIAQVYKGVAQVPEVDNASDNPKCPAAAVQGLMQMVRSRRPKPVLKMTKRTGSFRAVPVAVKVIHPQVRRAVDLDLKFLEVLAWVVDKLGFDGLGVSLALRQFATFLVTQADFTVEAENLRTFHANFGTGDAAITTPGVIEPWVSRNVLVMTFEQGEPLSSLLETPSDDAETVRLKKDAWQQIVDAFWAMVFKHRLVHADMHPGNVLWSRRSDGRVHMVLIDCGLAVDLHGEAGEDLSRMVKALLTQKEEDVGRQLMQLSERVGGRLEDIIDPEGFVHGIAGLIKEAKKSSFKLSKLNAGELMGRSLWLGRKHCVRFDVRFVNLGVAAILLQGVALGLNPDGDFVKRMTPFVLKAAVASRFAG
jgi:aarF domain-containing kinase